MFQLQAANSSEQANLEDFAEIEPELTQLEIFQNQIVDAFSPAFGSWNDLVNSGFDQKDIDRLISILYESADLEKLKPTWDAM